MLHLGTTYRGVGVAITEGTHTEYALRGRSLELKVPCRDTGSQCYYWFDRS